MKIPENVTRFRGFAQGALAKHRCIRSVAPIFGLPLYRRAIHSLSNLSPLLNSLRALGRFWQNHGLEPSSQQGIYITGSGVIDRCTIRSVYGVTKTSLAA